MKRTLSILSLSFIVILSTRQAHASSIDGAATVASGCTEEYQLRPGGFLRTVHQVISITYNGDEIPWEFSDAENLIGRKNIDITFSIIPGQTSQQD